MRFLSYSKSVAVVFKAAELTRTNSTTKQTPDLDLGRLQP